MFKNAQWDVTDYGLEVVKPLAPYEISADRLTETTERSGNTFYDWPVHMAEKTWVDIGAFNEAFEEALEEHKGRYSPRVDSTMLDASFIEARRIAAKR
jgi:hypothetical protein